MLKSGHGTHRVARAQTAYVAGVAAIHIDIPRTKSTPIYTPN